MNKVFAFFSFCLLALVTILPINAKADVTLSVVKPADWNGMNVHAWTKSSGDITSWPGVPFSQNGDKYVVTIKANAKEKVAFIINDGNGTKQTVNIDGLTYSDGKGSGLEAGSYEVTLLDTKDANGKIKWSISKSGTSQTIKETTSTPSVAPTAIPVQNNQVPAASTPKTGDCSSMVVVCVGVLAIICGVVGIITRKKIMG